MKFEKIYAQSRTRRLIHLELTGSIPDPLNRFRTKFVEHDLWETLLGEVNRQLGQKPRKTRPAGHKG